MTKKSRNWLLALFILAFPFVLFCGFLVFLDEPPPPPPPLPNPNGYDVLVKAGKMIKGEFWEYDNTNLDELRQIVSTNAEPLALARSALSNQCGVPLQFSKIYLTNHIQDLIAFRKLAQALVCEGRLAEKENHFADAAKSYLLVVRFGNDAGQGGTLVDEMLGLAVASLGAEQLQILATSLDVKSCRQAAAKLEALIADRQTWAMTMQQEEAWTHRTYGWRTEWLKWMHRSTRLKNLQSARNIFDDQVRQEEQLMIDLAARAYELDKGRPPASTADLVPDYLKAVPQDPFTGTNLVYSPR